MLLGTRVFPDPPVTPPGAPPARHVTSGDDVCMSVPFFISSYYFLLDFFLFIIFLYLFRFIILLNYFYFYFLLSFFPYITYAAGRAEMHADRRAMVSLTIHRSITAEPRTPI